MKLYVIYAEWCVDYEGGSELVGAYKTLEEARNVLKKRVDGDERILADEYGYKIYDDSPNIFDAGREGEYTVNHTMVKIEPVELEEE